MRVPSGEHVSESGHYYTQDGSPFYTIIGKNGKERNTTLADAKRIGNLFPSVTGILGMLRKPQLERWLQEQVLYSALTLPKPPGASDPEWIEAVLDDAKQQGIKAADLGTIIHAQVQGAYEDKLWLPQYEPYVTAVLTEVHKEFGNRSWIAEKSFAHPLGYGGKTDLHSIYFHGKGYDLLPIVIDFKSTSSSGEKLKKAGYPEHAMQLAAYREGLGIPDAICANVYISTTIPGEVFIKKWSEEEIQTAWEKFKLLLLFWQLDKKYKPEWK